MVALGASRSQHGADSGQGVGLYMICTMAKHEAEAQGCDDALLLDWRGQLAEGTGANIFLVINGELHTPRPVASSTA